MKEKLNITVKTEQTLAEIKKIAQQTSVNLSEWQFDEKTKLYTISPQQTLTEQSVLLLLNLLTQLSTVLTEVSAKLKDENDYIGVTSLPKLTSQLTGPITKLNQNSIDYFNLHSENVDVLQYELLGTFWEYLQAFEADQQFQNIISKSTTLRKTIDPFALVKKFKVKVADLIGSYNNQMVLSGVNNYASHISVSEIFQAGIDKYTQAIDGLLIQHDAIRSLNKDTPTVLAHVTTILTECEKALLELPSHKKALKLLDVPNRLLKIENEIPVFHAIKQPLLELIDEKIQHATKIKEKYLPLHDEYQMQFEKEQMEALSQATVVDDVDDNDNQGDLDAQVELQRLNAAQVQIHNKIDSINDLIAKLPDLLTDGQKDAKKNEILDLSKECDAKTDAINRSTRVRQKLYQKVQDNRLNVQALKTAFEEAQGNDVPFRELIAAATHRVVELSKRTKVIKSHADVPVNLDKVLHFLQLTDSEKELWVAQYIQQDQLRNQGQTQGLFSVASNALWYTMGYRNTSTPNKQAFGQIIDDCLVKLAEAEKSYEAPYDSEKLDKEIEDHKNKIAETEKSLKDDDNVRSRLDSYKNILMQTKKEEQDNQKKIEEVEENLRLEQLRKEQAALAQQALKLEKQNAKLAQQQLQQEKLQAKASSGESKPDKVQPSVGPAAPSVRKKIHNRRHSDPMVNKKVSDAKNRISGLQMELNNYLAKRKKKFKIKDFIRKALAKALAFFSASYEPDQEKRERFVKEVVPVAVKDFFNTGNIAPLQGVITQGRFFKPRKADKSSKEYKETLSYILDEMEQTVKNYKTEPDDSHPPSKFGHSSSQL